MNERFSHEKALTLLQIRQVLFPLCKMFSLMTLAVCPLVFRKRHETFKTPMASGSAAAENNEKQIKKTGRRKSSEHSVKSFLRPFMFLYVEKPSEKPRKPDCLSAYQVARAFPWLIVHPPKEYTLIFPVVKGIIRV